MVALTPPAAFQHAISVVCRIEGGFTNTPGDHGGATNCGVTQVTYDSYRRSVKKPTRSVRYLETNETQAIYRKFWDAIRGDELPVGLSLLVFDSAIHSGPRRAVVWLQEACGSVPDGICGLHTLEAARDAPLREVVNIFLHIRTQYLMHLTMIDPTQRKFREGWMNRMVSLRKAVSPLLPLIATV